MAAGFMSLAQNIIKSYETGELLSRRTLVDFTISAAAIAVGYVQLLMDFVPDRYGEGYDAGYYAGYKAGTRSERDKWMNLEEGLIPDIECINSFDLGAGTNFTCPVRTNRNG
ncbi:hypothetical protein [Endozoicomonas sp.]|uniref:hypothetical protein n=1 Tax=Endozoicomonas sp. TaxID=1892382 RepID=UPI0028874A6D|nr:hypothetical protein [Endozoicomonas sp.]